MEPSTPFRNSTIIDPFKREATGYVAAYSRPVFYAVSDNKILITNHRIYPSIKDECDRCVTLTGDISSELSGSDGLITTIKKKHFSFDNINSTSSVAAFLGRVWADAPPDCRATLYTSSGIVVNWIYEYGLGWNREDV